LRKNKYDPQNNSNADNSSRKFLFFNQFQLTLNLLVLL
jgi:hypothetical protein